MVDVGFDLMLGEGAGDTADLAAATETPPTTDRVDIDTQCACGVQ